MEDGFAVAPEVRHFHNIMRRSKSNRHTPDLDWFVGQAERLTIRRNDTFLACYPQLLQAFASLKPTEQDDHFVLAVHAVYGWMPTMLDLSFSASSGHLRALRVLTDAGSPDDQRIGAVDVLQSCVGTVPKTRRDLVTKRGKSLVGVSKLLHFLMPAYWPIWDRRVAAVWPLRRPLAKSYLAYAEELRGLSRRECNVGQTVNAKLASAGYSGEVTDLRAFEMLLFYSGKEAGG